MILLIFEVLVTLESNKSHIRIRHNIKIIFEIIEIKLLIGMKRIVYCSVLAPLWAEYDIGIIAVLAIMITIIEQLKLTFLYCLCSLLHLNYIKQENKKC